MTQFRNGDRVEITYGRGDIYTTTLMEAGTWSDGVEWIDYNTPCGGRHVLNVDSDSQIKLISREAKWVKRTVGSLTPKDMGETFTFVEGGAECVLTGFRFLQTLQPLVYYFGDLIGNSSRSFDAATTLYFKENS